MISSMRLHGFQQFSIIWAGQLVSMLGTGMTRFVLMVWAYQQTGAATTLALLGFFAWLPYLLISPIAGVWVDRLDRRHVLLLADTGSALATLTILTIYMTGDLAIWHLYLLEGMTSLFDAFQHPAYTAATTTLLRKEEYARANGMRSLALDTSRILAPMAAGALFPFTGIGGVMGIDLVTFLVALVTLLLVQIPPVRLPDDPADGLDEKGRAFVDQVHFGFRYIFARPGLRGLMFIFMGIEFFAALTYFSVLPALILARSGGDELALGAVLATLGGAGVVGGLMMSVWGLPRRKIHAIFGFCALSFLGGDMLFAVGRSLPVWLLAAATAAVFIPFITGANRTIWQSKVPPHIQGRVFSIMDLFHSAPKPLAYLLAGPLADRVLGPAMQPGGALVPYFGWLVGVGPGAGIGVMFVGTALCGMLISLSGYLFPVTRQVEDDLPDHDG